MVDVKSTLTETLAAHQPTQLGDSCRCGVGWADTTIAAHQADVLLGLSGVAVTALPELSDISEPVMARFDRLPFSMRMRVAADVMDAVNERHRREYPTAGISANEPISPSSMRYLADFWQQADAAAVVSEGETHPKPLSAPVPPPGSEDTHKPALIAPRATQTAANHIQKPEETH